MLFYIKSNNESLNIAGSLTLQFFQELKVSDLPSFFNHTDDVPEVVAHRIRTFHKVVKVETYKPKWIFTRANAHAKDSKIFINEYKLKDFHVSDFTRILAHETMHLIGYSHKGNSVNQYNLQTVPYSIGTLAEAWVKGIQ